MASHNHATTRRFNSELFEGVTVVLKKMTEGRRLDLRSSIGEPNKRIREILKEQSLIEKMPEDIRDTSRWLELQDEFDSIMIKDINPIWITWGVKQIEGLEADGKPLSVEDWRDWPSALFDEVLTAVKNEAELNGNERKNFESPITSGAPAGTPPNLSIVPNASDEGGGETEIVRSTSLAE